MRAGHPLQPAESPNLLILHTDQQSLWTIGAYGGTVVPTPAMDRLAREGARFTNAYTNSAVCTPSRGCFFTGRYPHAHGAYVNNRALNADEVTLAHRLAAAGYATGYAGKWHLAGEARPGWMTPAQAMGFQDCRYMFNRGHWKQIRDVDGRPEVSPYEVIGDAQSYTTDWLTNKAIDFLRAPGRAPFCYVVSYPDPHDPYVVREPYASRFKAADMPIPATFHEPNANKPNWASDQSARQFPDVGAARREAMLRPVMAGYCGEVQCLDDNIARILTCLDEQGLSERTIVVLTSDHGDLMGEHGLIQKQVPYDAAFHIPLVVRWPGAIPAGAVIETLTGTVDVQPTLLGLMGVTPTGREQGRDLSAIVRGAPAEGESAVYLYHQYQRVAGICTARYFFAWYRDHDGVLFDRERDPLQVCNLFHDPAHRDVVAELGGRVRQHLHAVAAPEREWVG